VLSLYPMRLPHAQQSLRFLEQHQLLFELAASDPFFNSERSNSKSFYDQADFLLPESAHDIRCLFLTLAIEIYMIKTLERVNKLFSRNF
jgi:hypothetical protein